MKCQVCKTNEADLSYSDNAEEASIIWVDICYTCAEKLGLIVDAAHPVELSRDMIQDLWAIQNETTNKPLTLENITKAQIPNIIKQRLSELDCGFTLEIRNKCKS